MLSLRSCSLFLRRSRFSFSFFCALSCFSFSSYWFILSSIVFDKENRQTALLNNAQNSLQARLAEREAQRAVEQARRAEQERKAQEQAKQERQQKHGKGITR